MAFLRSASSMIVIVGISMCYLSGRMNTASYDA
jgi:hypothetical protein